MENNEVLITCLNIRIIVKFNSSNRIEYFIYGRDVGGRAIQCIISFFLHFLFSKETTIGSLNLRD